MRPGVTVAENGGRSAARVSNRRRPPSIGAAGHHIAEIVKARRFAALRTDDAQSALPRQSVEAGRQAGRPDIDIARDRRNRNRLRRVEESKLGLDALAAK